LPTLPTAGCTISPHYDSVIAKVIVWAPNRLDAIARQDRHRPGAGDDLAVRGDVDHERSPVLVPGAAGYWQALRAPDVVGVSLRAAPLKRSFWTLSSWQDEQKLREYSRSQPHLGIMRTLGPQTASSKFIFFDAPATPAPTWPDALQRLAAPEPGK
jgi:hypothetical protein